MTSWYFVLYIIETLLAVTPQCPFIVQSNSSFTPADDNSKRNPTPSPGANRADTDLKHQIAEVMRPVAHFVSWVTLYSC